MYAILTRQDSTILCAQMFAYLFALQKWLITNPFFKTLMKESV